MDENENEECNEVETLESVYRGLHRAATPPDCSLSRRVQTTASHNSASAPKMWVKHKMIIECSDLTTISNLTVGLL